jgi:hypothetical protein
MNTYKKKSIFDLVRLETPYIVSEAVDWNEITGQFDSVCGIEKCSGGTGVSDKRNLTILAMLSNGLEGPVFASESTRGIYTGSTSRSIYNFTGGPSGNGDVSFQKSNGQYLDGGPRSWNINTNGGFTFVAVAKFVGPAVGFETLFAICKLGSLGNSIRIIRVNGGTVLRIQINNGQEEACWAELGQALIQDTWLHIVVRYKSADKKVYMSSNGRTSISTCNKYALDRQNSASFVGKNYAADFSLNGNIAGLLAVDTFLEDTAVAEIVSSFYAGEDVLHAGHPRVISTGIVSGNGAAAPLPFVGGTTLAKMNWGELSVPVEFTMCSVTRYTGGEKERILSCFESNPPATNFVHGHLNGIAGSTLYGNNQGNTNIYPTSISPNTNWVVVCGRNTNTKNSISVLVNEDIRAIATGGIGACALEIGYSHYSNWQLSKLYIWDYHLSDSDFALASSSLYESLVTDTNEAVCSKCPIYTESAANASACGCIAGTYPPNNMTLSVCVHCPAGKYKTQHGSSECSMCPAGTYGGGINCLFCPSGKFSTAIGAISVATCVSCRKGTYNEIRGANSSKLCLSCASGKFHRKLGAGNREDCMDCNCKN